MTTKRRDRRERERAAGKIVRARERLAHLETGGAPEQPIDVVSASVVETHARSLPCPSCEGAVRVDEHAVEGGLRVARTACTRCGKRRNVWFRLRPPLVQ